MKVAGFIAKRIAFNQSPGLGGQKSFSRFIIRLSTVATVISVAVMIVTLSFANGFQETVSQKMFSFWGHIRVQEKQPDKSIISEESPIIKNDSLVNSIKKDDRVKSMHAFSTKYAILKKEDDIEGVLIKGFDSSYDVKNIQPFIKQGKAITYNDSGYSKEIMLSDVTASRLKLKVNDKVLIYFIRPGAEPKTNKLTVTGIYKTGIAEYDELFAIADIKLIQWSNRDSLNMDYYATEVGGYEIFLNDYNGIDQAVLDFQKLDEFPDTWDTISAKKISPNIFDWLKMQDKTRNVLIGIMLIVAVINLITCLIILVLERIKMVGVLKALGATDWTVQKIFLWHSAIITFTGIIIGLAFGLGILWLQQATGFIKLPEDAYYMDTAAVKIVWWQIAAVCGGTLLVCFLVLLIPTLVVKRVQPVKAIQFR